MHPGVWMLHLVVDPAQWGKTVKPMKKILDKFHADYSPKRLIGWVQEEKKLVLKLSEKLGFSRDGAMPLPDGNLVMIGLAK